jgi:putative redox protein
MKVTTTMLSDELFEAMSEDHTRVLVDMRPAAEKESQSPTELLLSALAGCTAVDIVAMLKKRRKTVDRFEMVTEGTRAETPPKYFTKIHCRYTVTSPDATPDELQKIAALAIEKYCSVGASLKSAITFSVEVIRQA